MDMKFMDEYFEGIRADNIETLIKQNSDEWESREKQLNKAWDDFLNGLGIAHIFTKEHKLSCEEKQIWNLFFDLDCAVSGMYLVLLKGAYMVGAEDRDRMLH